MATTTIFLSILIVGIISVNLSHGENILFFFPMGSLSHRLSILPLVTALADRGHNVTIVTSFKPKSPLNHSNVHDLYSTKVAEMANHFAADWLTERLNHNEKKLFGLYFDRVVDQCRSILGSHDDPVLNYLFRGDAKFDLIINNCFWADCGLILAHRYKAKIIIAVPTPWMSLFHHDFGFPDEPSWIPDQSIEFEYPMGLFDRMLNSALSTYWYLRRQYEFYPQLESIMKDAYALSDDQVPSLHEVYRNASLVFILSHYTTDYARSLPPFIVNIGGMQCFQQYEPLTGEFQELLDGAENGAVLIAFGSNINPATSPDFFKKSVFGLIESFPDILFIWRWDGDLPGKQPHNLIVAKWLPQFQILGHKNVRAFISHAGLNSLTEATFHGVPVILMPLFSDQDYNSYRVEMSQVGIRVEVRDLTKELLVRSLADLLNDSKYTRNMKRLSAMMRDRPIGGNPIETGVFWTEFVLRHEDTKPLKPLRHLSWFQQRQLDVLLVVLIILVSLMTLLFATIFFLCRKFFVIIRKGKTSTVSRSKKIK